MTHVRRSAGALARAHGEAGEIQAVAWLTSWASCVERVRVGYAIRRGPRGNIISAHPLEKVSGDVRAVGPGGVSVLVEVKVRPVDDGLSWSDLAVHQHAALAAHRAAGAVSVVVWCGMDAAGYVGIRWMPYPDTAGGPPDWWRPRRPLTWASCMLRRVSWRPDAAGGCVPVDGWPS